MLKYYTVRYLMSSSVYMFLDMYHGCRYLISSCGSIQMDQQDLRRVFHTYTQHWGDLQLLTSNTCIQNYVIYSRKPSQRRLRASYASVHERACNLKFPSKVASFTRPNLSNVSNALPMGISTCIQLTQESPSHDLLYERMLSCLPFPWTYHTGISRMYP